MLGCLINPVSCIPGWATFLWEHWPLLLTVFLAGMAVGALMGWKGLLIAVTGGVALFFLRRGRGDEFTGGEVEGRDGLFPFRLPKRSTEPRRKRRFNLDTSTWEDIT